MGCITLPAALISSTPLKEQETLLKHVGAKKDSRLGNHLKLKLCRMLDLCFSVCMAKLIATLTLEQ